MTKLCSQFMEMFASFQCCYVIAATSTHLHLYIYMLNQQGGLPSHGLCYCLTISQQAVRKLVGVVSPFQG